MKFIRNIILGANALTVLLMFISGYAGYISPADHPRLAMMGFAFPVFLVVNICFAVLWMFVRKRNVIVPFVGMLLAYTPVTTYFPIHSATETEGRETLKIVSFNVMGFWDYNVPEGDTLTTLGYLLKSDADIICMQEYSPHVENSEEGKRLMDKYAYRDTIHGAKDDASLLAIYSRFPITKKQRIDIQSVGNNAGAFTLRYKDRDLVVANIHLESVGFSFEDKDEFARIIDGEKDRAEIKQQSRTLIDKLAESSRRRAPQADAVNAFICDALAADPDQRIILCGDFNDHPLSYVHNTIATRLDDCYAKAAFGAGYSMRLKSMYVRIDNIMATPNITPVNCYVDKTVNYSDHYPIVCHFDI